MHALHMALEVGMVGEGARALGAHVHIVLLLVRVIIQMLAKARLLLPSVAFAALLAGEPPRRGLQVGGLELGVGGGILAEAGPAPPHLRQADRHLLQLARLVAADVGAVGGKVARTHDLVAHQAH
jgi:hypothetical protein